MLKDSRRVAVIRDTQTPQDHMDKQHHNVPQSIGQFKDTIPSKVIRSMKDREEHTISSRDLFRNNNIPTTQVVFDRENIFTALKETSKVYMIYQRSHSICNVGGNLRLNW